MNPFYILRFLATCSLLLLCLAVLGQKPLENKIFDPNIYTVKIGTPDVPVCEPFLPLNSGLQLRLEFDEIGEENSQLSYKIIHCNADWTKSYLQPLQYIEGFWKESIRNFDYSFNTLVPYTHFEITFPNQNLRFKRSGNYIIKIFDTNDESRVLLQARFIVYEEIVATTARVKQPDRMALRDFQQEVDFSVSYNGFNIRNPTTEIQACILKNADWTNAIENLKPRFIRQNELVFDYDTGNTFYGGNEYRYFDLRDLSFNSERVYRLDKRSTPFGAQLFRDQDRKTQNYKGFQDLNGGFVIDNAEGVDPKLDADYVLTTFSLAAPYPLNEANIFINGAINFTGYDKKYLMKYNEKNQQYQTSVLVKQGFYNYRYVLDEAGYPLQPYKEGNYWQTENQYNIFIYYRSITDESDRVIGYASVNSLLN